MRWVKKWCWLIGIIFAVAVVIGWKEKQCQTQAYQCRTAYAAQLQSEGTAVPLTVYQQTSEEQAIAAACEPNGYFCRLFSAANLPTVLLVLVGIGAIGAAWRTLLAIEKQTEATKESVRLQEMQLRQWVDVENWDGACNALELSKPDPTLRVTFDIWNHTAMPLILQRITGTINAQTHTSVINHTLTPEHSYTYIFPVQLRPGDAERFVRNDLVIDFRGDITYEDAAKRKSEQPVKQIFVCGLYKPI